MATDDSQTHNQNQNQSQSQKLNRNCKTDSITEFTNLIKGWTKCWLAKICHRCRKPETSNSCCLLRLLLLVLSRLVPELYLYSLHFPPFPLLPIPNLINRARYFLLSAFPHCFFARSFFLHSQWLQVQCTWDPTTSETCKIYVNYDITQC